MVLIQKKEKKEEYVRKMKEATLALVEEKSELKEEIFSKSITAYDKVWRQQQRDLKRELPPAVAAAGDVKFSIFISFIFNTIKCDMSKIFTCYW